MIQPTTLAFLSKLARNNNREWFTANKELYTKAQQNVLGFVEEVIDETGKFDEEIAKLDAKKSLFRIYRDIRFSKDKIPYKTNFGASLGMGRGNKIAGYYLQIEPGKSFLAGGIYHPEPKILKEIRREISENSAEFLALINDKKFQEHFPKFYDEEKLVKIPQGFEKDDPMGEFLKLKNFIAIKYLSDEELLKLTPQNAAVFFEILKPLNDFLEAPFQ